jgi:3-oxoacyl-[acyl-carrier-protein] synthase II
MLAAFGLLRVLSARGVSCPFDVARDGFVIGEGAAMLVLAAERGGAVCEIAGVGRTLDANHITAPDADGDGAARAMAAALTDAGEAGAGYVQAHGTSTPTGDPAEAAAIRRVLGPRGLADARVSSVKGALGHSIAGAGAAGVLCAVAAVASGTMFPTAGLLRPDPACDLPHVMGVAARGDVRVALANSFAFGGANSCVVVRRAA